MRPGKVGVPNGVEHLLGLITTVGTLRLWRYTAEADCSCDTDLPILKGCVPWFVGSCIRPKRVVFLK